MQQKGVMKMKMEEMSRNYKAAAWPSKSRYNATNIARGLSNQSTLLTLHPEWKGQLSWHIYTTKMEPIFVLAELKKRGIKYKPTKKVSEMNKKDLEKHKLGWVGCAIRTMQNVLREHKHDHLAAKR
jgi:hypothetical protein